MGFNLSKNDWEKAKRFFKTNPTATTYDKKTSGLNNTFIKQGPIMLALAHNKDFLGQGSFGKVKIAEDEQANVYAVKIEGRDTRPEEDAELRILTLLKEIHAQIPRTLDQPKEFLGRRINKKLYTVMELKEGQSAALTTIRYYMQNSLGGLKLAIHAAQALKKVHELNIVHGDLSFNNFMVNTAGDQIMVSPIDWGFSRILSPGTSIAYGQATGALYHAPETPYISFASDIYSLGWFYNHILAGGNLEILFDQMCDYDPDKRPPIDQVIATLEKELQERQRQEAQSRKDLSTFVNLDNLDVIFQAMVRGDKGMHYLDLIRLHEVTLKDQDSKVIADILNKIIRGSKIGLDIHFNFDREAHSITLSRDDYEQLEKYLEAENKIKTGTKKMVLIEAKKASDKINKLQLLLEKMDFFQKNPSQITWQKLFSIKTNVDALLIDIKFILTQGIKSEVAPPHFTNDEKTKILKEIDYENLNRAVNNMEQQLQASEQFLYDQANISKFQPDNSSAVHAKIKDRYAHEQAPILEQKRLEEEKIIKAAKEKQETIEIKLKEDAQKRQILLEKKQEQLKKIVAVDNFLRNYIIKPVEARYHEMETSRIRTGALKLYGRDSARDAQIKLYQTMIDKLQQEKFPDDPLIPIKILIGFLDEMKNVIKSEKSQLRQVAENQLKEIYEKFPQLKNQILKDDYFQYLAKNSDLVEKHNTAGINIKIVTHRPRKEK